jgi:hypothetical protein
MADVVKCLREIGALLQPEDPAGPLARGVVPRPNLNHSSVVLYVSTGTSVVLLGADREHLADGWRGWTSVVIRHRARRLSRATVYKVAHHGSPNGDADAIWALLLAPKAHAVVTPFNRGRDGGRGRSRRMLSSLLSEHPIYG